jgi:hypothetical protein
MSQMYCELINDTAINDLDPLNWNDITDDTINSNHYDVNEETNSLLKEMATFKSRSCFSTICNIYTIKPIMLNILVYSALPVNGA